MLPVPPHPAKRLAAPHADSRSQTTIWIGPQGWRVRSEQQALSWIEELPGLDANGDGHLSPNEWQANLAEIQDYWGQHWSFSLAGWGPTESGTQMSIEEIEPERDGFGFVRYQRIALERTGSLDGTPAGLTYALTAFEGSSPGHRDQLTVIWDGRAAVRVFGLAGQGETVLEPGPALSAVRTQAIANDLWAGGWLLVASVAFWAAYRGAGRNGLALAALVAVLASMLGSVLPALPDRPDLWREWILPIALVYGLLDRWTHERANPWWPALLWGLALGGVWQEGWREAAQVGLPQAGQELGLPPWGSALLGLPAAVFATIVWGVGGRWSCGQRLGLRVAFALTLCVLVFLLQRLGVVPLAPFGGA